MCYTLKQTLVVRPGRCGGVYPGGRQLCGALRADARARAVRHVRPHPPVLRREKIGHTMSTSAVCSTWCRVPSSTLCCLAQGYTQPAADPALAMVYYCGAETMRQLVSLMRHVTKPHSSACEQTGSPVQGESGPHSASSCLLGRGLLAFEHPSDQLPSGLWPRLRFRVFTSPQPLALPRRRYVRQDVQHSWNANWLFSNACLFRLQRHSDHHAHAARPYQARAPKGFAYRLACSCLDRIAALCSS